jgi:hypothetical protein
MQERLNSPKAKVFLYQLLMRALGYVVEASDARCDFLAQFNGIYIQDSSKINYPPYLSSSGRAIKMGKPR